jgi:hypothetical protein
VEIAHGDDPIACHSTIKDADADGYGHWTHPRIRQCSGAAQYRRNVAKRPRHPAVAIAAETDTTTVFATGAEFIRHHTATVVWCVEVLDWDTGAVSQVIGPLDDEPAVEAYIEDGWGEFPTDEARPAQRPAVAINCPP